MTLLFPDRAPLLSRHSSLQEEVLQEGLSRREFFSKMGMLGVVAASSFSPAGMRSVWAKEIARPSLKSPSSLIMPEKSLSFYNIHTGEFLKKCTFWVKGSFISEGKTEINKFFRDHRTGNIKAIDPHLLILLHDLQEKLDSKEPLHLISGYRSPKTNSLLRSKSSGVASKSRHLSGQAADINLPGRLKDIHAYAKKLKVGGVGRYAQFVHVDTGPVRYW